MTGAERIWWLAEGLPQSRRNPAEESHAIAALAALLAASLQHPALQALAIVAGTFVLEDAATVLTALEVQSGGIALPVALAALVGGIVLGDIGLYGLGRLSALVPGIDRLVPRRRRDLGAAWLHPRTARVVVASRFLPGMRLPTYTACGFLRAPFRVFTLATAGATLAWTSSLFALSLWLGDALLAWLGAWRWAGVLFLCLALLALGRLAARKLFSAGRAGTP